MLAFNNDNAALFFSGMSSSPSKQDQRAAPRFSTMGIDSLMPTMMGQSNSNNNSNNSNGSNHGNSMIHNSNSGNSNNNNNNNNAMNLNPLNMFSFNPQSSSTSLGLNDSSLLSPSAIGTIEDKRKVVALNLPEETLLKPLVKKQRTTNQDDHHQHQQGGGGGSGISSSNLDLVLDHHHHHHNHHPSNGSTGADEEDDGTGPAPVPPSKEGMNYFNDNDVLSGRGGGTNVHPGNRNFRDLINLHRRAYLKARKNDKPAISRAIVRAIRETGGKFLRKDEKTGLWFEVGDDAAREKTSQALRQRAPEMRKLLFDTEREEARAAAEEHLRQQRTMFMGGMTSATSNIMTNNNLGTMINNNMSDMSAAAAAAAAANGMMNPTLLQAMAANKNFSGNAGPEFSQMFSAALLQGGINRLTPNGA